MAKNGLKIVEIFGHILKKLQGIGVRCMNSFFIMINVQCDTVEFIFRLLHCHSLIKENRKEIHN